MNEQLLGEYYACVDDLLLSAAELQMKNFVQHGHTSCYDHCIYVSYCSFLIAKKLGCNARSAARGGLLHDLFLYDWHQKNENGLRHGFTHPAAALRNAEFHFQLTDRERDIIKKHMWPLTLVLPRYKESYIVMLMDKYCAINETIKWNRKRLRTLFAMVERLRKSRALVTR